VSTGRAPCGTDVEVFDGEVRALRDSLQAALALQVAQGGGSCGLA
jgi:hypothetical protein